MRPLDLIDAYFIKKPVFRRWLTRLLEGDRERDVEVLGARLRVHPVKEHGYLRASRLIGRSSLLRDEAPVLINLAAALREGDTFVDIGANVGVFSLVIARLCGLLPGLRVYAFEANPDTFRRLRARAAEAGVVATHCAVSDHPGKLEFVGGAVSHVFTTRENTSAYSIPRETVEVPCRRLDEFPITGDSLFLKIDVEGQEMEVLEGARAFFDAGRVRAVYLDGYKDPAIAGFLTRRGFELFDGRTLEPAGGHIFSLLAIRRPAGKGVA